jgi:hypothetical protein
MALHAVMILATLRLPRVFTLTRLFTILANPRMSVLESSEDGLPSLQQSYGCRP